MNNASKDTSKLIKYARLIDFNEMSTDKSTNENMINKKIISNPPIALK